MEMTSRWVVQVLVDFAVVWRHFGPSGGRLATMGWPVMRLTMTTKARWDISGTKPCTLHKFHKSKSFLAYRTFIFRAYPSIPSTFLHSASSYNSWSKKCCILPFSSTIHTIREEFIVELSLSFLVLVLIFAGLSQKWHKWVILFSVCEHTQFYHLT